MASRLPPFEVRSYGTVGSTNEVAREIASRGGAEGVLVVADRQTHGRGRRGRAWFSPPGAGFWGTLILRPPFDGEALFPIGLAAAVALCETVEEEYDLSPAIQWPNDLMLGERKFAGILVEAVRSGGGIDAALLGIGVNLNPAAGGFPPELRGRAVSLGEARGRAIDRDRFTAALQGRLRDAIGRVYDGGFDAVREAYAVRSNLLDREVTLELEGGPLRGRAVDFGAFGELRLRTGEGRMRTMTHGEVIKVWR
jgi:BirA family biotin operon repressor/biotin-[acetyl-CoA-carboxylase] ligase